MMIQERRVRLWHWVFVGTLVVGVAAIVIFRARPIGNGNGVHHEVDPVAVTALKNDAIALMENWRFDLATEKLSELETLVPNEPLVRRNRAIAAVLAITPEAIDKVRNPDEFQKGFARATEAVDKLLAAEPKLPIAHLLAARLSEHREEFGKAIEQLEQAAQLSDSAPAFEAEVYLASRLTQDAALEARGVAALKRAAKGNSDNLWVLSELVVAQVVGKEPETRDTLTRLRELSGPFVAFIQQHYRLDILDLIDKANAAIEKQDWNTATRNVRVLSNVLRPEIATKLDLRKVVKHPLESLLSDFSPEWQKQFGQATQAANAATTKPIEVTFAEAAAADQLPALAGIRDVKIADFDLDGRWDVIVLLNGQVIVFGQPTLDENLEPVTRSPEPAARWVTLCEAVVPNGLTKLVAADLDRDSENTPEGHRFIGQRTSQTELRAGGVSPPVNATSKTVATGGLTPSARHENETIGASAMAEDADIDLLIYGDEGVIFLRNDFDATTKTRSLKTLSQIESFELLREVLAIAPADIDHDGDLDLIVSTATGMSIWQNNDSREHTKFADISSRSALPPKDLKPTVLLPVDWNFDVQTDVLMTGLDVARPGWLENISHGRLRWREFPREYSRLGHACSLHLMELQTSPLSWHLLAAGDDPSRDKLSTTPEVPVTRHEIGHWTDKGWWTGPGDGTLLADFDNDGKREPLTWRFGDSRFRINKTFELKLKNGSRMVTCGIADFDADGDEDVLAITDQQPIWIRNDGGNQNGWLDLSIRADKDRKPQRDAERTNIHGVGSWLELRGTELPEQPGCKSHVRIVEGQSTHFGLGSAKQVDAARIVWTNGVPQNILRPRSGEAIAAQQFLKGSCPYIYTWDGEQWAFFTDCLWAAPIGLQFAEGVVAPCREWEYLKIDGERLRPSNGEYRLMLTEELWEAAYFDQVQLLAIDHPADVEFFSNEKVGPPSLSEFKLHPVRQRRAPVAARDHRGRDVLPQLVRRDENYLRAFDKILQQGLTEEHFIELDLGKIGDAKSVTLFLTGWIFPTDTSINVSLSQNPDRQGPKPPAIWLTNEQGEWNEAIPYIGFPGGKTKTIAVDLTEALQRLGTRNSELGTRLRIVTSMELYWDEAFFTVDERPLEQTQTSLPLIGADLQFRGFSARLPHAEFGPERYDAQQITTEPQWPPMGGKFTRFGDVTELLRDSDDRLAILGAGDAVTIRFDATQAPALPAGWKRDFILHNVGYDKDADLNTIYGQFVEPLPFRAMRGYPDPTGASFPSTPTHRVEEQRFQTREQPRRPFWLGY